MEDQRLNPCSADISFVSSVHDTVSLGPNFYKSTSHNCVVTNHMSYIAGTSTEVTVYLKEIYGCGMSYNGEYRTMETEYTPVVAQDVMITDSLHDARVLDPFLGNMISFSQACCPSFIIRVMGAVSYHIRGLLRTAQSNGQTAMHIVLSIDCLTFDTLFEDDMFSDEDDMMAQVFEPPIGATDLASVASGVPLPSKDYSEIFGTEISSEVDLCTICLDEFECGMKVTQIPCSHVFHTSCVERWLTQSNSCPICRVGI